MASVSYDPKTGRRTVQVVGVVGKRHSIRLGKVDKKQAENARRFIEKLAACRNSGSALDKATAEWVASLLPKTRKRLERAGLVDRRESEERPSVAVWLKTYIEGRPDVKPNTRAHFARVANDLINFFGSASI
jgi:hypothetical protein